MNGKTSYRIDCPGLPDAGPIMEFRDEGTGVGFHEFRKLQIATPQLWGLPAKPIPAIEFVLSKPASDLKRRMSSYWHEAAASCRWDSCSAAASELALENRAASTAAKPEPPDSFSFIWIDEPTLITKELYEYLKKSAYGESAVLESNQVEPLPVSRQLKA